MSLRSTTAVLYDGNVETTLPNNGYICTANEASELLYTTTVYKFGLIRSVLDSPNDDCGGVYHKVTQLREGINILFSNLKREAGEARAMTIYADINLKILLSIPDENI